MIRNPIVAGQFYESATDSLTEEVKSLLGKGAKEKKSVLGIVSPHAGYVYSGSVAGAVYNILEPKSNYVIIGPNHTGLGSPFSVTASDRWKTPLGTVPVNTVLIETLLKNSSLVRVDELAHIHEHSIEVQLPFLQMTSGNFSILPMAVASADKISCGLVGKALAASLKELGIEKETLVIASSDMTHYEPGDSARQKDEKAIEAILDLDEEMLLKRIAQFDISMCGYAPTAIMLVCAKTLGARTARLVKYRTSGDVTGDHSSVVGYSGIIIS